MANIDRILKNNIKELSEVNSLKEKLLELEQVKQTEIETYKVLLNKKHSDLDKEIVSLISSNFTNNNFSFKTAESNGIINAEHETGLNYIVNISNEVKFISKSIAKEKVSDFKLKYEDDNKLLSLIALKPFAADGKNSEVFRLNKKIESMEAQIEEIRSLINDIETISIQIYGKSSSNEEFIKYDNIEQVIAAALK